MRTSMCSDSIRRESSSLLSKMQFKVLTQIFSYERSLLQCRLC